MKYTILNTVNVSNMEALSELLYDSFKDKISSLIKSKEISRKLILGSINPDMGFYAYTNNNELVGVIGSVTKEMSFYNIRFQTVRKEFSLIKAIFMYFILKFESSIILKSNEVSIVAIAVREEIRSQGIGTLLMNTFFAYYKQQGYKYASLYVVNTNSRAKSFYEALNFSIQKVYRYGFLTKKAGFSGAYYMRREI